jgi:uncharacterized RDD family membrane protein YckC
VSRDQGAGGVPAGGPIIDRHEEVPECFWAPAGAGFSRRAAALLIDHALQAALLGLFFLGALLTLTKEGLDTDTVLGPAGLQAALIPLVLLAALLSLAYHVVLSVVLGGTPGRRLAGIEVRTLDGPTPSPARTAVRWGAAVLGLACAGVGIVWAVFDSRRRGWADLLSGTVIVERRREDPAALTTPGGRGYHAPAVKGRDSSAGRATD